MKKENSIQENIKWLIKQYEKELDHINDPGTLGALDEREMIDCYITELNYILTLDYHNSLDKILKTK